MGFKKGDTVIVLSGKDKGKKGKILNFFPKEQKVVVERVNIAKKHQRATRNFQGGIIEKPMPLFASKVKLVCPRCNQPTRVMIRMVENKRSRLCRECEEMIDKG